MRIFSSATLAVWATCLGLSILPAQQSGDSPVKIFIMAGQSNMLGQGNMSPVGTEGTLEYLVANDPGNDYQFIGTGPEPGWFVTMFGSAIRTVTWGD